MIHYEKFILPNGLKIIVHRDITTPIAAVNILYNVGSKDEEPDRTGFAHLFEHLMFGGSIHIPRFDEPLQNAGGENNAFTNTDITNYYITLPYQNLETAFWLESDRMLSLAFSEKSLEVQRNVVIEEFKQSYLNQPYGDVWLELRNLAYKVHPYRWSTIGKETSHIANASMKEVKAFFKKFYHPSNAILTVAGNVETKNVLKLAEKWFAPIPSGKKYERSLPQEPIQRKKRILNLKRNVPQNAIYKVWHCEARTHEDYYATDLISDILSLGKSSIMYNELVKKQKLFSEINAYITGENEPGLFVVSGFMNEDVSFAQAEKSIDSLMDKMKKTLVKPEVLQKVKNKTESRIEFSNMSILNKAMNLTFFELIGDIDLINNEKLQYWNVTDEKIREVASKLFRESNSSVLYYQSNLSN